MSGQTCTLTGNYILNDQIIGRCGHQMRVEPNRSIIRGSAGHVVGEHVNLVTHVTIRAEVIDHLLCIKII